MNCYRAKSLGHSSREKYIWVVTGPQLGVRSTILGPHPYIQIQVVTQPQCKVVTEPQLGVSLTILEPFQYIKIRFVTQPQLGVR